MENAFRSSLTVHGVYCEAPFLCIKDQYEWLSYSVLHW